MPQPVNMCEKPLASRSGGGGGRTPQESSRPWFLAATKTAGLRARLGNQAGVGERREYVLHVLAFDAVEMEVGRVEFGTDFRSLCETREPNRPRLVIEFEGVHFRVMGEQSAIEGGNPADAVAAFVYSGEQVEKVLPPRIRYA